MFVCFGIGFLYATLAGLELKLTEIGLLCLPRAGMKGACHHATRKKNLMCVTKRKKLIYIKTLYDTCT